MKPINPNKPTKIIVISLFFITLSITYYSFNPSEENNYFPVCPSIFIFNKYCPGCGSQRAIHQLLHGNILEAFLYNPLLTIMFPLIIYMIAIMLYNFVFDKNIQLKLLYDNRFVISFFIILIMYFIARNLTVLKGTCLVPPN